MRHLQRAGCQRCRKSITGSTPGRLRGGVKTQGQYVASAASLKNAFAHLASYGDCTDSTVYNRVSRMCVGRKDGWYQWGISPPTHDKQQLQTESET